MDWLGYSSTSFTTPQCTTTTISKKNYFYVSLGGSITDQLDCNGRCLSMQHHAGNMTNSTC
jgi:hypothetical protein